MRWVREGVSSECICVGLLEVERLSPNLKVFGISREEEKEGKWLGCYMCSCEGRKALDSSFPSMVTLAIAT